MRTVKELMVSSPKFCSKNDTLKTVTEQLARSNIGSLPVLDEFKRVSGIITDRDICLTLGREGKRQASEIKVQEVINNKSVHTCSTEDNLKTALKIMRTNRVKRLPVVDQNRNLKGIITLNHILRETQHSSEKNEIEYAGDENILRTLHSIANREIELAY